MGPEPPLKERAGGEKDAGWSSLVSDTAWWNEIISTDVLALLLASSDGGSNGGSAAPDDNAVVAIVRGSEGGSLSLSLARSDLSHARTD